ncbi:peptidylprolyl isomerase [Terricaulis sp.]|uniref:peptidylprolyl isomerase n=1 Tax=Terricaulis sp. TaxID=2768686 RepID=UPI002AC6E99A|nr:SurA N-terminal domain-containing protein [Terricaulis sp.]MDZ4693237.1 SurA N-terminal domain-containing protein [Terricaulis sp.]
MLLQFRKFSRGGIAIIILLLVGGAMVLFLIPSGGLNFSPSASVATVSGQQITPVQLSRELELTLRSRRNNGENISQQEAIEAGLHEQILDSMIARNAMFGFADKAGVSASDAQVAAYIREIPGVLNPITGSFDQAAYAQFLGTMRYAQPEFESDIREELTTQLTMGSLVSGIRAPSSYGALAFAYQTETRVISIADAPASVVGAIPAPTEAQLQSLWEEVQEQLRVPEFRALSLVYARPQDFMARVNIPEQRLREEFDARRTALTRPERRTYVRLSAQSQEQANDAAARLNRGETPDAVAASLGLQVTRGADQARSEVPDTRVAEAVFTQARGQARAVQGQLTPWAVVRVDAITAPVEPDFATARGEIRDAIAADEAADLLNTAIGVFEDARAGGATFAEAARQSGLTIVTIAGTTQDGLDQNGQPVEALANHEAVLATAFQTPESEASDFMPVGDADVIVSVERIIPATVRPLEEVRPQLTQMFTARELGRRLRERGAQVVEAVRGGQTFAAAARANGFTVRVTSQAVNRQAAAAQIPSRSLPTQIFAAAQGEVVTDMRGDQPGVLVAQVERINRADPSAAPQVVEAARSELQDSIGSSFAEALQNEIVDRARVNRNTSLMERMFPATSADQGQ